jgi:hypothetical protein
MKILIDHQLILFKKLLRKGYNKYAGLSIKTFIFY